MDQWIAISFDPQDARVLTGDCLLGRVVDPKTGEDRPLRLNAGEEVLIVADLFQG